MKGDGDPIVPTRLTRDSSFVAHGTTGRRAAAGRLQGIRKRAQGRENGRVHAVSRGQVKTMLRSLFQSIMSNRRGQNLLHARLCPATGSDVKGGHSAAMLDVRPVRPRWALRWGSLAAEVGVGAGRNPQRPRVGHALGMALLSALACTLVSGCIVEERRAPPPPALDTEIEFDESVNIGVCGDAARFSWT